VQAQLAKVKESRARIVTAGDEQRRRIERDLHDGAQQRLVALALELKSAERRLEGRADPDVERLLASAAEESRWRSRAPAARRWHPSWDPHSGGLAVALAALASKAPCP
jgi:signal transduction histidine kinase